MRRYERERPGELLHVDTKQLGRFHVVGKRILKDGVHRNRRAGWQHLHVAIDDHSRLAYTEVLAGQDRTTCAAFLRRAVAWYADHGIQIERVLSDNAKAYHSHHWRDTCRQLGIQRRYTRPLHATHQRQGRSLHQDHAPRMGVPLRLPILTPPRSRSRRLDTLV